MRRQLFSVHACFLACLFGAQIYEEFEAWRVYSWLNELSVIESEDMRSQHEQVESGDKMLTCVSRPTP